MSLFFLFFPTQALHPIHDLAVFPIPQSGICNDRCFTLGAGYAPEKKQLIIPASIGLEAFHDWEFGGGLLSSWPNQGDPRLHLGLGLRHEAKGGFLLGGELLIPLNSKADPGLALSGSRETGGKRVRFLWQIKLGFMEAFALDESIMSFEAGAYPRLQLVNPVWLEWGFLLASQTNDFENWLSIEMRPGLRIPVGGGGTVFVGAYLELAGNLSENRFEGMFQLPF